MGVYDQGVLTVSNEVVNTEQAAAWDGHEGDAWTDHADRYNRAGRRTWQRLLDAQIVERTDRVLDIGCGTGASTRDVARIAADGHATGIDLSTRMLDLARRQAAEEGLDNAHFVKADAQVHPFEPDAYDVAISSFGVMFFNDPVAAFTNIGQGLRPGGRLAVLAWRTLAENEWLVSLRAALAVGRELPLPPPDAPTPFSLAEPERVHRIMGSAGFEAIALHPLDEPIDLGTDARDALEFSGSMGIVAGLTEGLDDDGRGEAMANLAALFEASETAAGVLLGSASWLISARKL
jgi:SAM-dependent methyltransferase